MILLTYAYIEVKKIENKIDKIDTGKYEIPTFKSSSYNWTLNPVFGNQVKEWNHIFKFIPWGEGAKVPPI